MAQEPYRHPSDTMKFIPIEEMMEWPNTPTMMRYTKAAHIFFELTANTGNPNNPEIELPPEALYYEHVAESMELNDQAMDRINATSPYIKVEDFYEIIIDATLPLFTTTAFPAIICYDAGTSIQENMNNQGETAQMSEGDYMETPNIICEIAQIVRDSDWMGLSPIFPSMKGTNALIWEAHDEPETVLCLIALHPEHMQGSLETFNDQFPEGEPSTLRDILKWHGANPVWIPYQ